MNVLPHLTELDVVPRCVGIRELATALALNTTLTSLDLCGRELGDADAHELAGMLESNTMLKTLRLGSNRLGDGARHLAVALERNKTLMGLSLPVNDIGDDASCHLSAALEGNDTLTFLNLGWNDIGDDGARHLATALERNTTLTTLNLSGNDIGRAGATALRTTLTTNCTLEQLYGVDGVGDILERNRGIRVAREQQVMLRFVFVALAHLLLVLSRCSGSAWHEAIQPRALFAGIVSVVCLQHAIDSWLQSNVKDVVRLIARMLWGTKVGKSGRRCNAFVTHSIRWHRSIQRGTGPSIRQRSDAVLVRKVMSLV